MKPGEPLLAFIFSIFLLVLWLGFLFHQDPRFAGSLTGGLLAVSGSLFLSVPLIYSIIKRIPPLKRFTVKRISFSNLLTIHIYSGFIGAILVLLHTGHKFHGALATTLTAMLLIVVFSGYLGRYLLGRISKEISEKKMLLTGLENKFAERVGKLQEHREQKELFSFFTGFFSRLFAPLFLRSPSASTSLVRANEILQLSDAIADVEYAISTHNLFRRAFSVWLKLHIALSLFFYFLLFLHVLGGYHFGLRWFT